MNNPGTEMPELGFSRTFDRSVPDTIAALTEALKAEGFGILSDIDVTAVMKARLGAEIEPYRILGACNPELAREALAADRSIGLLLPCNVVVRGLPEGGTEVSIADPETVFSLAPAAAQRRVPDLPGEARKRLHKALSAMA